MDGIKTPFSETVKYLGATLDSKICWKQHIENKTKAYKKLMVVLNSNLRGMQATKLKLVCYSVVDLRLSVQYIFFCKGALFRGKEGPPVLEKPARHLPRQGRGFCYTTRTRFTSLRPIFHYYWLTTSQFHLQVYLFKVPFSIPLVNHESASFVGLNRR